MQKNNAVNVHLLDIKHSRLQMQLNFIGSNGQLLILDSFNIQLQNSADSFSSNDWSTQTMR